MPAVDDHIWSERTLTAWVVSGAQEDMAALEAHIASDVSKANVEYYRNGGLAAPLEEMDIRVHTEYRAGQ